MLIEINVLFLDEERPTTMKGVFFYHFPLYIFLFNQKATCTIKINAGTSTNGPITPAKACPELIPKTPMETAIANSKLFPEAVNDKAALSA